MTEIWKSIKGYEGRYKISNLGRVKSLARIDPVGRSHKEIILKPILLINGYFCVNLHKNNTQKLKSIHRLVGKMFIKNPENKPEINHIDGVKTNNNAENLEWCTRKENTKHAVRIGLLTHEHKEKPVAQIKDGKVVKIFKSIEMAANSLSLHGSAISQVVARKNKTTGGFQWSLVQLEK